MCRPGVVLMWCVLGFAVASVPTAALADGFDEAMAKRCKQDSPDGYEEARGRLGELDGVSLSYVVYSCDEGQMTNESLLVITWGSKRQELTSDISNSVARDYKVKRSGRTLKVTRDCGGYHDDGEVSCTQRYKWAGVKVGFVEAKAPLNRKVHRKIKRWLAAGKITRARDYIKKHKEELSRHPERGDDESNELLLLYWRGAHAAALKAFRAGKKRRAGEVVAALVADTPIHAAQPSPGESVSLCLGLKGCAAKLHLGAEVGRDVRVVTDVGYLLEQTGHHAHAARLLGQITASHPSYTPAWLNLADAYAGSNRRAEAKRAYATYVKLREASGRSVPARVRTYLKSGGGE